MTQDSWEGAALETLIARAIYDALVTSAIGSPYMGGFEPVRFDDGDKLGGSTIDGKFDLEVAADSILAALKSSGLAIVPVEPTEAMLSAGYDALCDTTREPLIKDGDPRQVYAMEWCDSDAAYRAMLKAAPTT